jgi:hypothetical protein
MYVVNWIKTRTWAWQHPFFSFWVASNPICKNLNKTKWDKNICWESCKKKCFSKDSPIHSWNIKDPFKIYSKTSCVLTLFASHPFKNILKTPPTQSTTKFCKHTTYLGFFGNLIWFHTLLPYPSVSINKPMATPTCSQTQQRKRFFKGMYPMRT